MPECEDREAKRLSKQHNQSITKEKASIIGVVCFYIDSNLGYSGASTLLLFNREYFSLQICTILIC